MRGHPLFIVSIVAGLAVILLPHGSSGDAPNKEKIDRLIKQMGSDTFSEREDATKELAAIGVPALDALRKAAKCEDAEVRKRAGTLLPPIEMRAESIRLLAPKHVRLVYKDVPLGEALADLQKKSGYPLRLLDPDGKLKDRKITLESGETTFWHAFAVFCDKAELAEASWEDQMRNPMRMQAPPVPPGAPGIQPAAARAGRAFLTGKPAPNTQLVLKDGKPKQLPSDDRSAARVRVLGKSDPIGNGPENEIVLVLEASLEPKLQWQFLQSVHITKAIDNREQKLTQVIPQVEGAGGIDARNPANALPPIGARMRAQQLQIIAQQRMGGAGLTQQLPLQLKKVAKDAKSLKELEGVLTAQVLAEPQAIITTDNPLKSSGKSFKGQEGGSIRIGGFTATRQETTIQLELEDPPSDRVVPAQPNILSGVGGPIGAQGPGMKLPLAPGQPAGQVARPPAAPALQLPPQRGPIGGRPIAARQLLDCFNGLSVLDEKGKALPIDAGRVRIEVSFVQQANAAPKRTTSVMLVCLHEEGKEKPAKIVYLGRKKQMIEIPFSLKDIPLP